MEDNGRHQLVFRVIHPSTNVTLRQPRMTRDEFLAWAEAQDERYEFDGFAPVAMTGGAMSHNRITRNILVSLAARLRGGPCEPLGPDAGAATIGDAVRYPDALVTCSPVGDDARLVPAPVVVFEVVSPSSVRIDRIVKLLEYCAVSSILCYVIVGSTSMGVSIFSRSGPGQDWTATARTELEIIALPESGVELPVIELYQSTDLLAANG
jgi:Uma2 family endonuclease